MSCLAFGAMAVTARTLQGQASAPQVAFIRFAVGTLIALGMFRVQRRRPQLGRPWGLVLRGVLGGIAVLLYFTAIDAIGAGPATMLNYCSPVWAALFAFLFLKERPGPFLYAGLALATCGAVLVGVGSHTFAVGERPGWGAVAGLVSGIVGGAAMATVHSLRRDIGPLTVFLAFCAVGGLLCLPFALADWRPLSLGAWGLAIAVGGFAMVGQLLFTYGMGFTSASVGSATTQLTVAVGFLLELMVLGVAPAPLTTLGAVVCLGGVFLGAVKPKASLPRPTDT